ncbi:hypothetical protein D0Z07_0654 [Hyphodiscus hymeniophilus]|uniref:Uncharacterized protein n=1 Tax=Hyphodiscus hymeniophilus TaxID=353542 RepID=A0A9P6VRW0_9HELO|nr:hypothetical protein D0Z07_0654 [Hyphodiscus hymeniophilus]
MSLNPPRIYFPDELPSPTGIPIRAPPQGPKFAELDEVFNRVPYPRLSSQGSGCGGYNETQDESRSQEALQVLEAHITARTPYVELASSRLQAACGIRNDSIFDLPELSKQNLSPSMQALCKSPVEGSAGSKTGSGGTRAKSFARGPKKDPGIRFVPKSPVGLHAVDPKTGKGLREFLLQKGKECGMRKQECSSITFHDFTPDMRTGNHQNVLLGHYGVENCERVDVYEVDLPAIVRSARGEEILSTETWLWILISRPLVSYDPRDTSTFVAPKGSSRTSPAGDMFYTPRSYMTSPQKEPIRPTPPNFPHATPLSWVVFAAPKAHVTTYPSTIAKQDGTITHKVYPLATPSRKVVKRTDYDFSFSGIPLFEFSSAEFVASSTARTEFLSIEQMGAWYESDDYAAYTEDEYKRMFSLWEDGEWGVNAGKPQAQSFDPDGRPTGPMPSPNRGVWWKIFFERMSKDVERWKKIRTAMGRGKCRVVVKWNEYPNDEALDTGEAGGEKHSGAKKGPGKRLTRSESRRRSGLAAEVPVGLGIGGAVGVGALGESSKSRAAGNLGLAGIVGAEKEKAKVRKR